jgi:PLP dependent protein
LSRARDKITTMAITVAGIETNLRRIRECVARSTARVGRQPEDVTIIGVSKTHPAEAIRAAHEAGIRHFGENRVQEFQEKFEAVKDLGATWHLIGHLQGNKVSRALKLFRLFDSLDSLPLAQRLEASVRGAEPLPVLIEVRTDAAATKSGVLPEDVPQLVEVLLGMKQLMVRGLMTIPAYFEDPDSARPFFRELRMLRDSLVRRFEHPLPVLSMGMSHDFEVAIEEGSTEVRIGTALFGARAQV